MNARNVAKPSAIADFIITIKVVKVVKQRHVPKICLKKLFAALCTQKPEFNLNIKKKVDSSQNTPINLTVDESFRTKKLFDVAQTQSPLNIFQSQEDKKKSVEKALIQYTEQTQDTKQKELKSAKVDENHKNTSFINIINQKLSLKKNSKACKKNQGTQTLQNITRQKLLKQKQQNQDQSSHQHQGRRVIVCSISKNCDCSSPFFNKRANSFHRICTQLCLQKNVALKIAQEIGLHIDATQLDIIDIIYCSKSQQWQNTHIYTLENSQVNKKVFAEEKATFLKLLKAITQSKEYLKFYEGLPVD